MSENTIGRISGPVQQPSRKTDVQTPTRTSANERQNVTGDTGKALPQPSQGAKPGELAQVVKQLNEHVQSVRRELHFSVDEVSGNTVIRVVNPETAEVIRQIPPEEALALAHRIAEMEEGALFSTQV